MRARALMALIFAPGAVVLRQPVGEHRGNVQLDMAPMCDDALVAHLQDHRDFMDNIGHIDKGVDKV